MPMCVCVLGEVKRDLRNTTGNRGRRLKTDNKKKLNAGVQSKHAQSKISHDTLEFGWQHQHSEVKLGVDHKECYGLGRVSWGFLERGACFVSDLTGNLRD